MNVEFCFSGALDALPYIKLSMHPSTDYLALITQYEVRIITCGNSSSATSKIASQSSDSSRKRVVRSWSPENSVKDILKDKGSYVSLCWNPSGSILFVGTSTGYLIALNFLYEEDGIFSFMFGSSLLNENFEKNLSPSNDKRISSNNSSLDLVSSSSALIDLYVFPTNNDCSRIALFGLLSRGYFVILENYSESQTPFIYHHECIRNPTSFVVFPRLVFGERDWSCELAVCGDREYQWMTVNTSNKGVSRGPAVSLPGARSGSEKKLIKCFVFNSTRCFPYAWIRPEDEKAIQEGSCYLCLLFSEAGGSSILIVERSSAMPVFTHHVEKFFLVGGEFCFLPESDNQQHTPEGDEQLFARGLMLSVLLLGESELIIMKLLPEAAIDTRLEYAELCTLITSNGEDFLPRILQSYHHNKGPSAFGFNDEAGTLTPPVPPHTRAPLLPALFIPANCCAFDYTSTYYSPSLRTAKMLEARSKATARAHASKASSRHGEKEYSLSSHSQSFSNLASSPMPLLWLTAPVESRDILSKFSQISGVYSDEFGSSPIQHHSRKKNTKNVEDEGFSALFALFIEEGHWVSHLPADHSAGDYSSASGKSSFQFSSAEDASHFKQQINRLALKSLEPLRGIFSDSILAAIKDLQLFAARSHKTPLKEADLPQCVRAIDSILSFVAKEAAANERLRDGYGNTANLQASLTAFNVEFASLCLEIGFESSAITQELLQKLSAIWTRCKAEQNLLGDAAIQLLEDAEHKLKTFLLLADLSAKKQMLKVEDEMSVPLKKKEKPSSSKEGNPLDSSSTLECWDASKWRVFLCHTDPFSWCVEAAKSSRVFDMMLFFNRHCCGVLEGSSERSLKKDQAILRILDSIPKSISNGEEWVLPAWLNAHVIPMLSERTKLFRWLDERTTALESLTDTPDAPLHLLKCVFSCPKLEDDSFFGFNGNIEEEPLSQNFLQHAPAAVLEEKTASSSYSSKKGGVKIPPSTHTRANLPSEAALMRWIAYTLPRGRSGNIFPDEHIFKSQFWMFHGPACRETFVEKAHLQSKKSRGGSAILLEDFSDEEASAGEYFYTAKLWRKHAMLLELKDLRDTYNLSLPLSFFEEYDGSSLKIAFKLLSRVNAPNLLREEVACYVKPFCDAHELQIDQVICEYLDVLLEDFLQSYDRSLNQQEARILALLECIGNANRLTDCIVKLIKLPSISKGFINELKALIEGSSTASIANQHSELASLLAFSDIEEILCKYGFSQASQFSNDREAARRIVYHLLSLTHLGIDSFRDCIRLLDRLNTYGHTSIDEATAICVRLRYLAISQEAIRRELRGYGLTAWQKSFLGDSAAILKCVLPSDRAAGVSMFLAFVWYSLMDICGRIDRIKKNRQFNSSKLTHTVEPDNLDGKSLSKVLETRRKGPSFSRKLLERYQAQAKLLVFAGIFAYQAHTEMSANEFSEEDAPTAIDFSPENHQKRQIEGLMRDKNFGYNPSNLPNFTVRNAKLKLIPHEGFEGENSLDKPHRAYLPHNALISGLRHSSSSNLRTPEQIAKFSADHGVSSWRNWEHSSSFPSDSGWLNNECIVEALMRLQKLMMEFDVYVSPSETSSFSMGVMHLQSSHSEDHLQSLHHYDLQSSRHLHSPSFTEGHNAAAKKLLRSMLPPQREDRKLLLTQPFARNPSAFEESLLLGLSSPLSSASLKLLASSTYNISALPSALQQARTHTSFEFYASDLIAEAAKGYVSSSSIEADAANITSACSRDASFQEQTASSSASLKYTQTNSLNAGGGDGMRRANLAYSFSRPSQENTYPIRRSSVSKNNKRKMTGEKTSGFTGSNPYYSSSSSAPIASTHGDFTFSRDATIATNDEDFFMRNEQPLPYEDEDEDSESSFGEQDQALDPLRTRTYSDRASLTGARTFESDESIEYTSKANAGLESTSGSLRIKEEVSAFGDYLGGESDADGGRTPVLGGAPPMEEDSLHTQRPPRLGKNDPLAMAGDSAIRTLGGIDHARKPPSVNALPHTSSQEVALSSKTTSFMRLLRLGDLFGVDESYIRQLVIRVAAGKGCIHACVALLSELERKPSPSTASQLFSGVLKIIYDLHASSKHMRSSCNTSIATSIGALIEVLAGSLSFCSNELISSVLELSLDLFWVFQLFLHSDLFDDGDPKNASFVLLRMLTSSRHSTKVIPPPHTISPGYFSSQQSAFSSFLSNHNTSSTSPTTMMASNNFFSKQEIRESTGGGAGNAVIGGLNYTHSPHADALTGYDMPSSLTKGYSARMQNVRVTSPSFEGVHKLLLHQSAESGVSVVFLLFPWALSKLVNGRKFAPHFITDGSIGSTSRVRTGRSMGGVFNGEKEGEMSSFWPFRTSSSSSCPFSFCNSFLIHQIRGFPGFSGDWSAKGRPTSSLESTQHTIKHSRLDEVDNYVYSMMTNSEISTRVGFKLNLKHAFYEEIHSLLSHTIAIDLGLKFISLKNQLRELEADESLFGWSSASSSLGKLSSKTDENGLESRNPIDLLLEQCLSSLREFIEKDLAMCMQSLGCSNLSISLMLRHPSFAAAFKDSKLMLNVSQEAFSKVVKAPGTIDGTLAIIQTTPFTTKECWAIFLSHAMGSDNVKGDYRRLFKIAALAKDIGIIYDVAAIRQEARRLMTRSKWAIILRLLKMEFDEIEFFKRSSKRVNKLEFSYKKNESSPEAEMLENIIIRTNFHLLIILEYAEDFLLDKTAVLLKMFELYMCSPFVTARRVEHSRRKPRNSSTKGTQRVLTVDQGYFKQASVLLGLIPPTLAPTLLRGNVLKLLSAYDYERIEFIYMNGPDDQEAKLVLSLLPLLKNYVRRVPASSAESWECYGTFAVMDPMAKQYYEILMETRLPFHKLMSKPWDILGEELSERTIVELKIVARALVKQLHHFEVQLIWNLIRDQKNVILSNENDFFIKNTTEMMSFSGLEDTEDLLASFEVVGASSFDGSYASFVSGLLSIPHYLDCIYRLDEMSALATAYLVLERLPLGKAKLLISSWCMKMLKKTKLHEILLESGQPMYKRALIPTNSMAVKELIPLCEEAFKKLQIEWTLKLLDLGIFYELLCADIVFFVECVYYFLTPILLHSTEHSLATAHQKKIFKSFMPDPLIPIVKNPKTKPNSSRESTREDDSSQSPPSHLNSASHHSFATSEKNAPCSSFLSPSPRHKDCEKLSERQFPGKFLAESSKSVDSVTLKTSLARSSVSLTPKTQDKHSSLQRREEEEEDDEDVFASPEQQKPKKSVSNSEKFASLDAKNSSSEGYVYGSHKGRLHVLINQICAKYSLDASKLRQGLIIACLMHPDQSSPLKSLKHRNNKDKKNFMLNAGFEANTAQKYDYLREMMRKIEVSELTVGMEAWLLGSGSYSAANTQDGGHAAALPADVSTRGGDGVVNSMESVSKLRFAQNALDISSILKASFIAEGLEGSSRAEFLLKLFFDQSIPISCRCRLGSVISRSCSKWDIIRSSTSSEHFQRTFTHYIYLDCFSDLKMQSDFGWLQNSDKERLAQGLFRAINGATTADTEKLLLCIGYLCIGFKFSDKNFVAKIIFSCLDYKLYTFLRDFLFSLCSYYLPSVSFNPALAEALQTLMFAPVLAVKEGLENFKSSLLTVKDGSTGGFSISSKEGYIVPPSPHRNSGMFDRSERLLSSATIGKSLSQSQALQGGNEGLKMIGGKMLVSPVVWFKHVPYFLSRMPTSYVCSLQNLFFLHVNSMELALELLQYIKSYKLQVGSNLLEWSKKMSSTLEDTSSGVAMTLASIGYAGCVDMPNISFVSRYKFLSDSVIRAPIDPKLDGEEYAASLYGCDNISKGFADGYNNSEVDVKAGDSSALSFQYQELENYFIPLLLQIARTSLGIIEFITDISFRNHCLDTCLLQQNSVGSLIPFFLLSDSFMRRPLYFEALTSQSNLTSFYQLMSRLRLFDQLEGLVDGICDELNDYIVSSMRIQPAIEALLLQFDERSVQRLLLLLKQYMQHYGFAHKYHTILKLIGKGLKSENVLSGLDAEATAAYKHLRDAVKNVNRKPDTSQLYKSFIELVSAS